MRSTTPGIPGRKVPMNPRRIVACLSILLMAAALQAQVAGRVTGTVIDGSGAGIPGAAVTLRIAGAEGVLFTTRTTQAGVFTLSTVTPSSYDLTVDAEGFQHV